MPTAPAAVSAQSWGWRHSTRAAWAVRDVSFQIQPGERVLLLGASGSGKSTLLQAIAGVLGGADEGEAHGTIRIDGVDAVAARGRCGLVLQDPDAQVILSRVGDDIAFGCENLGVARDDIWRRVEAAKSAVGLDVPLTAATNALSGGQKQRLAIAGVLAMRPGVMLLDEPTANLDPGGAAGVREAVAAAAQNRDITLVVVEHRVDTWLDLIDRVIVLGDGGVVADGTPADVFSHRAEDLARTGVWVPGSRPVPTPPAAAPGGELLHARDLAVARVAGEPVAERLQVEVRAGTATALLGANGAGKSTAALTLAGLLPPAAGEVNASAELAGPLGLVPFRWKSRDLLTRIGMVFQEPDHQLLTRSVRAELEVGPRALALATDEIRRRVDELLVRLRLEHVAAANPYTLSGGEKRRLTVAAALATRPRVLVLDEPTFGQDARTWAELVALCAELRDDGAGLVLATHDTDLVAAMSANRVQVGP